MSEPSTALVVYTGDAGNDKITSCDYNSPTKKKFVGLSNQGATCYMNSLLQTLYMTPQFRASLYKWSYNAEKDGAAEECIPLQLQKLFGLLQLSDTRSVDTIALTKSFGWEGAEVFQQQDVQELCRVLFDALEESFKGTDMEDVIDELYAGELVDYVKCIDIDYSSERRDKFLDYSLAIRPFGSDRSMKSLTECIEHYLEPEILDGDNKYYAESEGRKVDAIKGLKFSKLPHIMSVQLKRFVYDFSGETIIQKKINDKVTFPMVLDMNKYVSTRRKRSLSFVSDCSDGGSTGDGPEQLDEFEKFLKRRITELRAGKDSANSASESSEVMVDDQGSADSTEGKEYGRNDGGKGVQLVDEYDFSVGKGLPSYFLAGDADAKKRGSPASMENEADMEMTSIESNTIYNDFYSLPDLVDCNGRLHPDQKSAVGRDDGTDSPPSSPNGIANKVSDAKYGNDGKRGDDDEEDDEDEVIEELDAQALLKERGEWVYELYAVLVHSGAIAGGHYYVYIKDLDTNKWWNFNDSLVDEISEKQVREAWGGGTQTRVNYYGTKTTYESCANAYMLMYRKVSPVDTPSPFSPPLSGSPMMAHDAMRSSATAATVSSCGVGVPGSLFPSNDMVPEYIRKEVNDMLEAAELKRREELERFNKLALKVHWKGTVYPINTMRQDTYKMLLQKVWDELELAKGKGGDRNEDFSDLEDPSIVPLTRIRLRVFNAYHKFAQEPFHVETKGDLSLEAIRISTYRELTVEVKAPDEEWEVYESDGFNLQVNQYDPAIDDFKAPASIRLPRSATLGDLRKKLASQCTFGIENIRFLKLTLWSYAEVKSEELKGDHFKLMSEFRLYDGQRIYWEEDSNGEVSASPSVKAFTAQSNRINVMVSLPDSTVCDQVVAVDRRWNVKQFREKLSTQFDLPVDSFRIFRKSSVEAELNGDAMQSLFSLGVYSGVCLCLTTGRPLLPGHYMFKVFLYKATNRPGFVDLPLPPDDGNDYDIGNDDADKTEKDSNSDTTSIDDIASTEDGDTASPEGIPPTAPTELNADSDVIDDDASVAIAAHAVDVTDVPVADAEVCSLSTVPVDINDIGIVVEADARPVPAVPADPLAESEQEENPEEQSGGTNLEDDYSGNDITGFGYKMVELQPTKEQFEFLMDTDVEPYTLVNDLRKNIFDKLSQDGFLPAGATPHHIRIRQKARNAVTAIICDGLTLRENQVAVYSGRELAVEILDKEEHYTTLKNGDLALLVQKWERSTWTLSRPFEVILRGNMPIKEICKRLAYATGIPLKSLKVLLLQPYNEIRLSDLHLASPVGPRMWISPINEERVLSKMQWHMRDWDLIMVQDESEPLKQLSKAEQQTVDEAKANASNYAYDYYSYTSNTTTVYPSVSYPTGNGGGKKTRVEQGIHIKTQKDREKERQLQEERGADGSSPATADTTEVCHQTSTPNLALFADIE